jgi:hypothetical protein
MQVEAPAFDHPMNVEFSGVGEVIGYNLGEPITLDTPPTLTLVWQAGTTPPEVSYTVFAQLLNAEGRVIAQSDSIPAAGTRPTTGWRAEEFVEDSHTLVYNDLAASGEATLIIGLYDAMNGQRLHLADGSDFAVLAEGLDVR